MVRLTAWLLLGSLFGVMLPIAGAGLSSEGDGLMGAAGPGAGGRARASNCCTPCAATDTSCTHTHTP